MDTDGRGYLSYCLFRASDFIYSHQMLTVKHTMAHDVNGAFKRYGNIVIPSPDTAAAKILNVVDSSTREKEGGALVDTNGAHLGW